MNRKRLKIVLIIAGIISIFFALKMMTCDLGDYVSQIAYGGDAYTGIQNASATAACNLVALTSAVCYGFSGLFLMAGIILIGVGICIKKEKKNIEINSEPAIPVVDEVKESVAAEPEHKNEEIHDTELPPETEQ